VAAIKVYFMIFIFTILRDLTTFEKLSNLNHHPLLISAPPVIGVAEA
jgi:hypothetical protein